MRKRPSGLLISDFNIQNLAATLSHGDGEPSVEVSTAPFGQVVQVLSENVAAKPDFAVAWTQPQSVLGEVNRVLEGLPSDLIVLDRQVDGYCELLTKFAQGTSLLMVPTWVVPISRQGHGGQDLLGGTGITRVVMHANNRMVDRLSGHVNIVPLNAARWMELAGGKGFSPRLWYSSKTPFSSDVFTSAARDVKSTLAGMLGLSRKLVVLDLDDTLWGGIVGDLGWESIVLGGHDADGEALVDFQRELKRLLHRGITLAIVSKNQADIALKVVDEHPEMVLRRSDFAAWRINWNDKAANIVEIAKELNLGLDAIVFIDDNPAERDRVRQALPRVLVPDWPSDKRLYPQALLGLDCFNNLRVTEEDRQRSAMYAEERQRAELKAEIGSVDSWLASLGMQLTTTRVEPSTMARASQLLNKTNQMNLSTRRLSEADLVEWSGRVGNKLWLFRVKDKFGDSGICGIASATIEADRVDVVDFILSCRVMGRNVEEEMLRVVINWARRVGADEVRLQYRSTEKNRPCLEFLLRSGLENPQAGVFLWKCDQDYPAQSHIQVRLEPEDSEAPERLIRSV
jgi:FkbH-like protein